MIDARKGYYFWSGQSLTHQGSGRLKYLRSMGRQNLCGLHVCSLYRPVYTVTCSTKMCVCVCSVSIHRILETLCSTWFLIAFCEQQSHVHIYTLCTYMYIHNMCHMHIHNRHSPNVFMK